MRFGGFWTPEAPRVSGSHRNRFPWFETGGSRPLWRRWAALIFAFYSSRNSGWWHFGCQVRAKHRAVERKKRAHQMRIGRYKCEDRSHI